MLTRLEVSGFKNLLDLEVDFGPFTCIAGENGAGKSNVFDAIHFLSLLTDHSLMDAAQQVRAVHEERLGDPRDLFWNGYHEVNPTMTLTAEMIVPRTVEDDFGTPAKPTISFLRYSVTIGYEAPIGIERIGRLVLRSESLHHINQGDASEHLHFPHSAQDFRKSVVFGRRSGVAFISTSVSDSGDRIISIHQDGGSRGQPRPAAASRARATVVSTVTSGDDPTVLCVRREMQSWQRLALEPSALRAADRYVDPRIMTPDGRHLPATLYRIATKRDGDTLVIDERVYHRISTRLAELTGVDVSSVRVEADDSRETLTITLVERSGLTVPARSLSEGTLRFLALSVLLEDTDVTGLICMEEPENGIHPGNLRAMVSLLRELAVDADSGPDAENPFRQVIINTHSPYLIQLIDPQDLLFASTEVVKRSKPGSEARTLRLRPMVHSWRAELDHGRAIHKLDILPYLVTPSGLQFEFALDEMLH